MLAQQDPTSLSGALGTMVITGLVLIAVSVLISVLAVRTADGRIGPNRWVGIRTDATRTSNEAWMLAHETARIPTLMGGRFLAASAVAGPLVAVLFSSDDAESAVTIWGVVISMGLGVVAVFSMFGAWSGHQAAKNMAE